MSNYAFIFVCQQGPIEIQVLLLAASLKDNLRCEYELIAAVPTPCEICGKPKNATLDALRELGVRIEYIRNSKKPESPGDAFMNKFFCFKIQTSMEKLIFMDSDMLCLREFLGESLPDVDFCAGPAYRIPKRVIKTYEVLCGLKGNKQDIVKNIFYFQSSFMVIKTCYAKEFSNIWQKLFSQITNTKSLSHILYLREQILSGVAVKKLGISHALVDESYNYPISRKAINYSKLPFFCHYHKPKYFLLEPGLLEKINITFNTYPVLSELAHNDLEWRVLFSSSIVKAIYKINIFTRRLLVKFKLVFLINIIAGAGFLFKNITLFSIGSKHHQKT